MTENKIEIIYDHYKETFANQLNYISQRNRYFLFLLVISFFLFFQFVSSNVTNEIIDGMLKNQIADTLELEIEYIHSILVFCTLWILMLYYQVNTTISRQYKYLKKLEEELSNLLSPFEFNREGKFYQKHITKYNKISRIIYVYLIPLCIILSILGNGIKRVEIIDSFSFLLIFDYSIYLLIILISIFYIISRK